MGNLIFINQMQELWNFLEKNTHLQQTELAEQFITEIIVPQKDKYLIFLEYLDEEKVGVYLSHLLQEPQAFKQLCLAPDTVRIEALAREIVQTFPDFPQGTEVYLMPSFGEIFACMAFPLGFESAVRIGLDELTGYSETAFKVTVQRELMHIYHYHLNPDYRFHALDFLVKNELPKLYQLIWSECLAALAVKQLNPTLSYADVLNNAALVEAVDKVKSDLAKMLEYSLDTTSISGFFYFKSEHYPQMPVGCGYYIGLLLLEDIATRYSIHELFILDDETILSELKISVKKLCGKVE